MQSNKDADYFETAYFDAVLRPHRSMSPAGFAILMCSIALCGFAIGVSFFLAGAWPVLGFAGLEIALLYFAFRANLWDAKRSEHIRLTDQGLAVTRVQPNGRRSRIVVDPGWVTVSMENPPRHDSKLTVRSRGKGLILGDFLTPGERLEVAEALRQALDAYRAPKQL